MDEAVARPPKLPPPWFKHTFSAHSPSALPAEWRPLPLDPGEQRGSGRVCGSRPSGGSPGENVA